MSSYHLSNYNRAKRLVLSSLVAWPALTNLPSCAAQIETYQSTTRIRYKLIPHSNTSRAPMVMYIRANWMKEEILCGDYNSNLLSQGYSRFVYLGFQRLWRGLAAFPY